MAQLAYVREWGAQFVVPIPEVRGPVKVVLFCGGQGMRMREASEAIPKPMVPIGNRPILWHVMKYYAHFGFNDFVLCLGYKAEAIKHFFLTYNEAMANDFVLTQRRREGPAAEDRHPRLEHHVRRYRPARLDRRAAARRPPPLRDDEIFLANYGDTLTDADLPAMIDACQGDRRRRRASWPCARTTASTSSRSTTTAASARSAT